MVEREGDRRVRVREGRVRGWETVFVRVRERERERGGESDRQGVCV